MFNPDTDCKRCKQTVENCECHIPNEVKHAGLYSMCKDLKNEDGVLRRFMKSLIRKDK